MWFPIGVSYYLYMPGGNTVKKHSLFHVCENKSATENYSSAQTGKQTIHFKKIKSRLQKQQQTLIYV